MKIALGVGAALAIVVLVIALAGGSDSGPAVKPQWDGIQIAAEESGVLVHPDRRDVVPQTASLKVVDQDNSPIAGCLLELPALDSCRETDSSGVAELGTPGFYAIQLIPPQGFFPLTVVGHMQGETRIELPQAGEVEAVINMSANLIDGIHLLYPSLARHTATWEAYSQLQGTIVEEFNLLQENVGLLANRQAAEHADHELQFLVTDEDPVFAVPRWDLLSTPQLTPGSLLFMVPPGNDYCLAVRSQVTLGFDPRRKGDHDNGFSGFFSVSSGERTSVSISSNLSVFGTVAFDPGVEVNKVRAILKSETHPEGGGSVIGLEAKEVLESEDGDFFFMFYGINPGMYRVHIVGEEVTEGPTTFWIASSRLLRVEAGDPTDAGFVIPGDLSIEVESGFIDPMGQQWDLDDVCAPRSESRFDSYISLKFKYSVGDKKSALASGGSYVYFWDSIPLKFGEPLIIKGLWQGTWFFKVKAKETPRVKSNFIKESGSAREEVEVTDINLPVQILFGVSEQGN